MRRTFTLVALAASLALPVAAADLITWNVDPAHSAVAFTVNHFFTPVKGHFRDFDIDLKFDPEHPEAASVEARIDVASIDTGNERRDNHLRSADFFDAATYPTITFKSSEVREIGDGEYVAVGDLTIKDVTRRIELPFRLLGVRDLPEQMRPMFGGAEQIASFRAEVEIDRNDFHVGVGNWAATLVVGGKVKIELVVEANH